MRELRTSSMGGHSHTQLPGLCCGHRRAEPLQRLQAKFAGFKARMVCFALVTRLSHRHLVIEHAVYH